MNKRNFFKSLLAAPAALILKPEVNLIKENIPPILDKPKPTNIHSTDRYIYATGSNCYSPSHALGVLAIECKSG